jgi:glycosyltransferase involved in cell wall biosynthesis
VPIGVLFMQSQAFFGADSAIHAELMKYLDRAAVEVHVAVTTQEPDNLAVSARRRLAAIPNVRLRPTLFGPSIHGISRADRARRLVGGARVVPSLLSLASYVRRHDIRIIHCTEKPRDAFYGVLLGKLTGARSLIHMHVGYDDWLARSVKWSLGQADGLVAISDFVARSLSAAGYRRERIHVVFNALDTSGWDPCLDGSAVRAEFGIPTEAPVVGIVSRIFKWKGHEYLVEAMAEVTRQLPEARLIVVGEDDPRADPGSGSFRAQLEARARELGIERSVLFTGFRTDVPRLMAALDVFAHPSWEEPFGMVFLEANAMRKPVVCWASGGAPEVVVNGETGLLVERGSVPGLAAALVTLLSDRALRERMGDAGRRRVVEVFTPERMARGVLDVYRDVLSSPGTRRAR